MRRELAVNATPPETRVALLEDGRTVEVLHERHGRQGLVGNVYLGRVHRVLPGMHAAFLAIGLDRDAFLYVQDVLPRRVEADGEEKEDLSAALEPPRIEELLREGQDLVIQVTKDPLSGKGPRVTANIALPGRLLVCLPGARGVGVSRRITDDAERERLRAILEGFPPGSGWIARTAAQGCGVEDFLADRAYLEDLGARIRRKAENGGAPLLLHRELDLPLRAIRDLVAPDFDAIVVDDAGVRDRIVEFLSEAAPGLAGRVELDEGSQPLFSRLGVEEEIENALKNRVALSSGGSVVIQQTEALVAIDVNTGKFVGSGALEETVFATNLEAVGEVARQIRLRDLGGILVVDFIDMEDLEHRREVFEAFERELARDRARTRLLQISEFGLVEVTRQRTRGNLERTLTRACPCCNGSGRVKTDLTVALDLRRDLLAGSALYAAGETVRLKVRSSLAHMLIQEESGLLSEIETRLGIRLELLEDDTLLPTEYEIL
ncbi:MAG TPA: Rne/Rng family ribonuclease [Thermoanaerobaculia bacterium]|nr:Rne/Rng family ribonuclease [Thermoanaerobaculia bacterium]